MPAAPVARRGRPPSAKARAAILAAAFALLAERGFAHLAFEAVAERAKVGKATIYRWWPDRAALACDAFFAATESELRFPETGTAREDFRRQIHQLATLLRGQAGGAFAAMIAGARIDPAIGRAVAERWVAPRQRWGRERLARATAEGECHAGLDPPAALGAMYSLVYAPLLLGLGVPSPGQLDAGLAIVMRGIFLDQPPVKAAGRLARKAATPSR